MLFISHWFDYLLRIILIYYELVIHLFITSYITINLFRYVLIIFLQADIFFLFWNHGFTRVDNYNFAKNENFAEAAPINTLVIVIIFTFNTAK